MVQIKIRPSESRGYVDKGWLKASHSFSFSNYYDEEYLQFGNLRVLNEDHIEAINGFGFHSHKGYEIITYMIQGEMQHKDSMGHQQTIKRNQIQFTRAGTGIKHSEVNPNKESEAHLLQIWVESKVKDSIPYYDTLDFNEIERINQFKTLISPGDDETTEIKDTIGINASFYMSSILLEPGKIVNYNSLTKFNSSKKVYIHVTENSFENDFILLNQIYELKGGDAAYLDNFIKEDVIELTNKGNNTLEFVVFEMYDD